MYDKRIFTRPELPVLLGILRASPTALEVDGMGSIVLSVCSSVKFREGAHMMSSEQINQSYFILQDISRFQSFNLIWSSIDFHYI